MARDEAYRRAEQKIEKARCSGAKELRLSRMGLGELPESVGQLTQLQSLDLSGNQLTTLPEVLGQLTQLQSLDLSGNQLTMLPESVGQLAHLYHLRLDGNKLMALPYSFGQLSNLTELSLGTHQWEGNPLPEMPSIIRSLRRLKYLSLNHLGWGDVPEWLGDLHELEVLWLTDNRLADLPAGLGRLARLTQLYLANNILNPELAAAHKEGLDAIKRYLRAKAEAQVVLNEAKLILVGEGGVGKSSLLGALRGEVWVENRDTTHGVETKVVEVTHQENGKKITLNAWDFGGQPLYRPTHQLFFTAPAVYLAVWDPRRGPKQCCVDEWIEMVKHRTYDDQRSDHRPRVLVVATNGGPKERRDHIDEDGLRKQFGDMIIGFYHIDSLTGYGLDDLKKAIARTANDLPCVGRSVAASWKRVLDAVRTRAEQDPYISYIQFEDLCREQQVTGELVGTYGAMLNELGYLVHYRTDPGLKDTVILKADWLSKAISFVLEDQQVKEQSGLVDHGRLGELWFDAARPEAERYPAAIHPIFLRLMERFELSYRVILPEQNAARNRPTAKASTVEAGTSLVSQLQSVALIAKLPLPL